MALTVEKHITEIKQSPVKGLVNALILLVAIPVIIIAMMSLSLYFAFIWLKNRFAAESTLASEENPYYLELDLVKNEKVHIVLIEDEFDTELTLLNEAWQQSVYNEETCLYRARTVPLIPEIDGNILSFYYKEVNAGLVLQVLPSNKNKVNNLLHSYLVFLNYNNLTITKVDEPGAFFLYNDTSDDHLIHGLNKEQKLLLKFSLNEDAC